jgi:hypothetical protein
MTMPGFPLDAAERSQLCDLLEELGPGAPTLLGPWTARDLAAHLILRERDHLAAPGLVLAGPGAAWPGGGRQRLRGGSSAAALTATSPAPTNCRPPSTPCTQTR